MTPDLKIDYVPIRYSYNTTQLSINSLVIGYSYGSSVEQEIEEPFEGHRASSTQQILNNLPQWMELRQSYNSNGWKLTNSWGISFDNIIENVNKTLTDFNLITADPTYLSKVNFTDVTSKEVLEFSAPRNLLFNSSFSIRDVSRTLLPAGWLDYLNNNCCYIDYTDAAVAPCSITSSCGELKISQQVLLDNIQTDKVVGSLYVKTLATSVDVKLYISVQKIDGTSVNGYTSLTSTSSEWKRISLPLTINSQVYRVNYSIIASCNGYVSISAPQLELGTLTSWTNSRLDNLPYTKSSTRLKTVYACSIEPSSKRVPIFSIDSEDEFSDYSIPTRINKIPSPNKNLSPYTSQAYGRIVDQLGEVLRTEYAVQNGDLVERSISPSRFDIYGRYSIRDLRYFNDLEYGTSTYNNLTIEPLATCIRKDILFVACKETYNGLIGRTLKILRPKTPPNGETYLESLVDFDLKLDFESKFDYDQIDEEDILSISFSDIDKTYMVITTTNNIKYYYKLYFDYYYFSESKNRLYTIESYKDGKLTIL